MAPSSTYAEVLKGKRGSGPMAPPAQIEADFPLLAPIAAVAPELQNNNTLEKNNESRVASVAENNEQDDQATKETSTAEFTAAQHEQPEAGPVCVIVPTPVLDHGCTSCAQSAAPFNTNEETTMALPTPPPERPKLSPDFPPLVRRPEFLPSFRSIVPSLEELRQSAKGEFADLWFEPQGYDLTIHSHEFHWRVHRNVLVRMSEWMERYLPPENENDEPVVWYLDNWHPGLLGSVLRYMYIENYPGGDFDPKLPFNTSPIVHAVAHFLAGASMLCRAMMDHALAQIDTATDKIKLLGEQGVYNHHVEANMDLFESMLRRALLMTYDEPDQWRIRALRVVMGKLLAVAFPWVLKSPDWGCRYAGFWGSLHARVVTDHKWLVWVGKCEPCPIILDGFENMAILWVKYRGDDWKPEDDLLFPDRDTPRDFFHAYDDDSDDSHSLRVGSPEPEAEPATDQVPASVPDIIVPAGGKKRSKAIPIMRPDGTPAELPPPATATGEASGTKFSKAVETQQFLEKNNAGRGFTGFVKPGMAASVSAWNEEGKETFPTEESFTSSSAWKGKGREIYSTDGSYTSFNIESETSSLCSTVGTLSPIPDVDEDGLSEAYSSSAAPVAAGMININLSGPYSMITASATQQQAQPSSSKPPAKSWPGSPDKKGKDIASQRPPLFPGGLIFPFLGLLPGGPHYFKETSTGEPLNESFFLRTVNPGADLKKHDSNNLKDDDDKGDQSRAVSPERPEQLATFCLEEAKGARQDDKGKRMAAFEHEHTDREE